MTRIARSGSFRQCRLLFLAVFAFGACNESAPPSGPLPSGVALARAGGGKGPSVRSTNPDSATVDTTLNVRIMGSGFDAGSRADWAFKGVVSEKILTNSTQFVSATELVANITIARNADLGSHDVIVTTSSGKGGIGTELFLVTMKTTDLGTLAGTWSRAGKINNSGDIVGTSALADDSNRATFWARVSTNGWTIRQLTVPPNEFGGSTGDINDAGVAVGISSYRSSDGTTHEEAVRWISSGAPAEYLGIAGSHATGINSAGQIIGGMIVNGVYHGFLWENGVTTDLGSFGGGEARASGINSTGVIVGFGRTTPQSASRAVIWRMGVIAELPALSTGAAMAHEINDDGVIVGQSVNATPEYRAVRWVPAAGEPSGYRIEDLGIPVSFAHDINNSGEIVGYYRKSGLNHAFYWHPVRGRVDLPDLRGQAGSTANGINDLGDVVGYGWSGTGQSIAYHGIVWTGVR